MCEKMPQWSKDLRDRLHAAEAEVERLKPHRANERNARLQEEIKRLGTRLKQEVAEVERLKDEEAKQRALAEGLASLGRSYEQKLTAHEETTAYWHKEAVDLATKLDAHEEAMHRALALLSDGSGVGAQATLRARLEEGK